MSLYREDMRAGFLGLIAGTIALAVIMYGIVQWTNGRYEGKQHGGPTTPPAAGTH